MLNGLLRETAYPPSKSTYSTDGAASAYNNTFASCSTADGTDPGYASRSAAGNAGTAAAHGNAAFGNECPSAVRSTAGRSAFAAS